MRRPVLALVLVLAGCGGSEIAPPVVTPSAPVFADLTAPDASSAVHVLAFDPVAASTVVEPIIFLTGRDYCASYGVPPGDKRCSQGRVVEGSRVKVTLPLDPQVRLRLAHDCRETTCAATLSAFAAAVRAQKNLPARITVHGGVVVELAQLS